MIIIFDSHLRLTIEYRIVPLRSLPLLVSVSLPPRLMHPRGAHFPYEICIVPFGPFGQTRFITGTERQYNGREGGQCRAKGGRFITVPVHLSTGEQCNTQAHKILRPKHAFRRVSFQRTRRIKKWKANSSSVFTAVPKYWKNTDQQISFNSDNNKVECQ